MDIINSVIEILEKHPIPFALFAFGFVIEAMIKERGEGNEIS